MSFFYFLLFLSLFTIPIVKENTRVKLVLAFPMGTPITLAKAKEVIDIPPLVADKTVKVLSK